MGRVAGILVERRATGATRLDLTTIHALRKLGIYETIGVRYDDFAQVRSIVDDVYRMLEHTRRSRASRSC